MFTIADVEIREREMPKAWSTRGWREYRSKPRIYVHPKGEGIMAQLVTRHTRPYTEWRKQVVPQVLEQMGLPADTKVRWSQRAGCSCPCSPGFIVEGTDRHVDVWVDVVEA